MRKRKLEQQLKNYKIKKYTINEDGSVDVDGNVNLSYKGLTEIPFNFNKVSGIFNCAENKLTSLKGAPKKVGGDFGCSYNKLTSLEGVPKKVGGNFYCSNNDLISLKGIPLKINGNLFCVGEKLNLKDISDLFKSDIKGNVILNKKWDDSLIFKKYMAMKNL